MMRPILAVLTFAALLLCAGCRRDRDPKADEIAWITSCIAALPDHGDSMRRESPEETSVSGKNRYEVYFDTSASMRPYLVESSEAKSRFRLLLKEFGQIEPSRISFYSFGVPNKNGPALPNSKHLRGHLTENTPPEAQPPPDPVELRALRDENTYTRLANDYVPLIAAFKSAANPEVQRLVVSDGVQSPLDSGPGSVMGGTAGEINRWINSGGTFAAFVFRSPYHCDPKRGTYYFSETRREQGTNGTGLRLIYNTDRRPFMMFAFLSSPAALARLKSEFKDVLSESEPWSLEIEPPTVFKPLEIALDEESSPQPGRPQTKLIDTRYQLPDLPLIPRFVLLPGSTRDGRFPLRYKISVRGGTPSDGGASLTATERLQLLSSKAIAISCYLLDASMQDNPAGRWKAIEPLEGRVFTRSPGTGEGADAVSNLTLFIPERSKGLRKRCWYLVLKPNGPGLVYDTDVASYATTDDSDIKAQDRILNFQSLVDEVCRGRIRASYAPSGSLVVTD